MFPAVIFPVVQKQHQLLVTLLLCNAAAMEVSWWFLLIWARIYYFWDGWKPADDETYIMFYICELKRVRVLDIEEYVFLEWYVGVS